MLLMKISAHGTHFTRVPSHSILTITLFFSWGTPPYAHAPQFTPIQSPLSPYKQLTLTSVELMTFNKFVFVCVSLAFRGLRIVLLNGKTLKNVDDL